jgi:hypothetical protein
MDHREEPADQTDYPLGRGYGHDYMRGGEVLGGYGYSEREEYERTRGELGTSGEFRTQSGSPDDGADERSR